MFVHNVYAIERYINSLDKHNISVAAWYILRLFLNFALPAVYICKKLDTVTQKDRAQFTDRQVIISLTSYPARIKKIHIVLETLIRQTIKADKIILWLASSQFDSNDPNIDAIKDKYGDSVDIRYCEDIMSHKKYYFAMQEYPGACIVTADDDIFYPEDMLEQLLKTYQKYPDCIVAMRAHRMTMKDGMVQPYSCWIHLEKEQTEPDIYLCATSGGGCLFPPQCLSDHAFDMKQIKELCLYADDIWLKCMSYIKGTKVVLTGENNPEVIDLIGCKRSGLAASNVTQKLNDKQFLAVSEYYDIRWT